MGVFYQDHTRSYFSKVTVNNCYPAHLHKEVELFYCISGSIVITIDGQAYTLTPGDLTICFPDIVHRIETKEESKGLLIIFSPEFVQDFTREFVGSHPKNCFLKSSDLSEHERYLLNELTALYQEPKDLRLCRAYLSALVCHLNDQIELVPNRIGIAHNPIRLILEYIQTHLKDPLTLELLSRELGLSRFYISHLFADKIGVSFSSYINRERAKTAAELLKNPELDITDVCFHSGFYSMRTFYRSFREVYQTTPKEYQAQLRY